ncbi:hypothetical protein D0469_18925 [Peribacillus saganii]|uniref:Uncharacterized protein n=1 Tax=Peribacillus saganii TaxID=2303992 RepID=A0A372LET0_9BACI|nr:hypothetical protein [Peribacillus saganii]RFU64443.1 hypothetical protein D0469_18925 [Peribacillus saganii]
MKDPNGSETRQNYQSKETVEANRALNDAFAGESSKYANENVENNDDINELPVRAPQMPPVD